MLPVAKEFHSIFLLGTLILLALQVWVGVAVTILWLPWLLFVFLVRDFHRVIPPAPLANISPVDGKISHIDFCRDPFLDRDALCYTIEQSKWGEFNIHSPTEGKVEQLWVSAPDNNAKVLAFWIRTDEQDDVVIRVELNSSWQHASTNLHPGERVGQGRRCGFAARGCTVHVYLPANAQSIAQDKEKVIAGRSIIARFVHS